MDHSDFSLTMPPGCDQRVWSGLRCLAKTLTSPLFSPPFLSPPSDQRRHMDMEGFAADATQLRKMLTSIDRKLHEMRLIDR